MVERRSGLRQRGFGVDEIVFPAADLVQGLPGKLGILLVALRQFRQAGFDVARVHDAEAAAVAQTMGFLQQDALAEAVEGRNLEAPGGFSAQQARHPLLHFARGLVGKSDGADLLRGVTLIDQPRDLAGDYPGFSAAGTGQHQAGAIDTFNRLTLRPIEIFQVQGC